MSYSMLDNLKCYFPFIAKDVQEYKETGPFEITVRLTDGTVYCYDDMEHTIRKLPLDSNAMTERECRKEFGIRLRKVMQWKGITQKELSDKTGITQAAISRYVKGHVSPSFYTVDKIAKALDCTIEDLRYIF